LATEELVKVTIGTERRSGRIVYEDDRAYFYDFGYWPVFNDWVKMMEGRKWHGYDANPKKAWSIPLSPRNRFQLDYVTGKNPYAPYDGELIEHTCRRSVYAHQLDLVRHGLTRHYCIWAAEMGTGKTLASIELIEAALDSEIKDGGDSEDLVYYIGPKSALMAVSYEFIKWKSPVKPTFLTYEALVRVINNWQPGKKAPKVVIFDESSRLKTPTAQRSQAARSLADGVRKDWGPDGYVVLMSGSPAPKSPVDWWHQAEVACPGFLIEGDIHKAKSRLGIVHQRENPITGGKYPHLVSWKDDDKKCAECGEYESHRNHAFPETEDVMAQAMQMARNLDASAVGDTAKNETYHPFKPSVNEVAKLYRRLKGLALVKFKRDCLDLPEKVYKTINVTPSQSALRAAKLIADTAPSAIRALTLLRELSDGFQYVDVEEGTETCPNCKGEGVATTYLNPETDSEIKEDVVENPVESVGTCSKCNGNKVVPRIVRTTNVVECPKDAIVSELLEDHDDIGRIVFYGGFTGSIDRVVSICRKAGWHTIRVDGRGWLFTDHEGQSISDDAIPAFQDQQSKYPKIAFIGHPGSAGMGLTLTASPTICYYSNDFNAESRIQSEDRIHRAGMDKNRGATIIDLIHLPTDLHVLENLRKKRDLQALSMGDVRWAMENPDAERSAVL
jgi:hypothetical protein